MEIKLDFKALEALFPEGSEARVRLQQCVIEEFTRKHIKTLANNHSLTSELRTLVEKHRDVAMTEFLEYGKSTVYGGKTMQLNENTKNRIRSDIKSLVEAEIQNSILSLKDSLYEDLRARINIELKSKLNAQVNEEVSSFIKNAVSNAMSGFKL